MRLQEDPWAPYEPSAALPWNLQRVVHLHRRAGFGATWSEIQRDLEQGHTAALERLLAGQRTAAVPEDFEGMSRLLVDGATSSPDPARLKAWWLWRMLFTNDPLGERLALLWHDHFATSNLKVNNIGTMRRQNEIFRAHARGPFAELLRATVHDPALLLWLDAQANRVEHPNENLGRELMELFTLGVGNYGERDVKEAARALTGWRVTANGAFLDMPEHHDAGEKTVLGRTGPWRGDDLLGLLLEQPALARRLAVRLCELFLNEESVTPEHLAALASGLRAHDLDIGWGVALVLRSRAFFSGRNRGGKVLGPAQFVVGAARALECFDPPPSTILLAEWTARLGQDLFYPPTVFGWAGGRAWISTGSMLARSRFATELAAGALTGRTSPLPRLAERHALTDDPRSLARFLGQLLLGSEPGAELEARLLGTAGPAGGSERLVARLLSSPEAQLG